MLERPAGGTGRECRHESGSTRAERDASRPCGCQRKRPRVGRSGADRGLGLRQAQLAPLNRERARQRGSFVIGHCAASADIFEDPHPITKLRDAVGGEAATVKPVPVQRLVHESGRSAGAEEPDHGLPVRTGAQGLVEAADLCKRGTPVGRPRAEAALENGSALVGDIEGAALAELRDGASVELEVGIRAEEIQVRSRAGELRQRLEAPGQVGVV
jgi:hypothetical protein